MQELSLFKRTDATEDNVKQYDISTYEFPYSPDEKDFILETMNNASADDLIRLSVSKTTIQKLIKYKAKISRYQDLSQLLFVNGLGIKDAEKVCGLILQGQQAKTLCNIVAEYEDKIVSPGVVYKKRYVKPQLQPHELNVSTSTFTHAEILISVDLISFSDVIEIIQILWYWLQYL